MLPIFNIYIDENDETGIDFNSIVDYPAHQKSFISFNKQVITYSFNEEKRIVTGVMISAGVPIYRNDDEIGEHYVVFSKESIESIKNKFHKNLFNNNVNLMHNHDRIVKGVYMIESYTVSSSDKNKPLPPVVFDSQKLKDGSWICSYKVDSDEAWSEIKKGGGFSVEGRFYKGLIKIKRKDEMKRKRKSIFELLFSEKQNFASATSTDGVVFTYDGELGVETQMFIDSDGQEIVALEGAYQLTLEDGSIKDVIIDANGVVAEISDAQANSEEQEAEQDNITEEAMRSLIKDVHDRFNDSEKKIELLEQRLISIEDAKESKFKKEPLATGEAKKLTIKELLSNK